MRHLSHIKEEYLIFFFLVISLSILLSVHAGGSDSVPPTYSNNQTNNTLSGESTLFSLLINDDTALNPNGRYIFSTNNSGSWVNDSPINFTSTPQWANVTKILNDTKNTVVGYKWYLTDNSSNQNVAGETISLGPEGTYTGNSFVTTGEDAFPYGITQNNTFLWTSDDHTGTIFRYWINGTYTGFSFNVTEITNIGGVIDDITNDGTFFWITDWNNRTVFKYWMNGTYAGVNFTTVGFNLKGITTDGTFLWVLESNSFSVSKYWMNGNGTRIASFSINDLYPGYPRGITQDGTYFWIVTGENDTAFKYWMNGTYIGTSFSISEVNYPQGIDNNGTYFWVLDSYTAVSHSVYQYYGPGIPEIFLLKTTSTGDSTNPTINLDSPEDNYNTTSQTITFNATASDDINLTNMSLYGNWTGSWIANTTNTSPINNTLTTFTISSLPEGKYVWNILTCDNSSNCVFDSSNRTFTISSETVTVTSPSGGGGGGGSSSLESSTNDTNVGTTSPEMSSETSNMTDGTPVNQKTAIRMSDNFFVFSTIAIIILIIIISSILIIRSRRARNLS